MNLVKVHVVGLEPLQALVELKQDGLARQAAAVRLLAHHALHLGGNHHRFAAHIGLQKPAQYRLALAARVHICGIKKVNAQIEGLPQKRLALFFIQRPRLPPRQQLACGRTPVGHASEADARYFHSGVAKVDVFHRASCTQFTCRALLELHAIAKYFRSIASPAPSVFRLH